MFKFYVFSNSTNVRVRSESVEVAHESGRAVGPEGWDI